MAIKSIRTSDGVKLYDTDTNRLAGSVGSGTTPPTAAPEVGATPLPSEAPTPLDVAAAHERYRATRRDEDSEVPADRGIDLSEVPAAGVAVPLARSLVSEIDDAQFADMLRLLDNSLNRKSAEDMPAPTDEQWNALLDGYAARLADTSVDLDPEVRARLVTELDAVRAGGKPDGRSFTLLSKLDGRMWAAKMSLDEGYRQISAWYDTSPVNVKQNVEKYRREYLAAAEDGQAPDIDPGYAKGYKITSGSAPKDDATIYGHMMAEKPELYDPAAAPTKFVAFDTETTGRDPRDSNILQVGLVEYDHEGTEVRRFVSYIRPPAREDGSLWTGDEGAVAVHGILPEHVKDAPSFAEVVPMLREYFEGATVIGQNVIAFDARHLQEEMIRAAGGNKAAGRNLWPRAADTLWHAQRFIHHLPNRKLATLSKHFGLPDFAAHDAAEDAHATAQLFFTIRRELKARQLAAYEERKANDPWAV